MEEETYLSIDRYLANEMESEEKLAFEARLRQDRNLAEKLEIHRSAVEVLSSKFQREEKEAMFKHNLAKIAAERPVVKGGKIVKLNWYAWAAAASVALLCVVLFYTSSSKPDYSQFAHYEPIALVERGSGDATKLQAQQTFNSKQYYLAIILFSKLLEEDKNNTELKLYKGIALLEVNRIDEANELFRKIQKSGLLYANKGTWMLALSALKQKDYDKCASLLRQIPKEAEEYGEAQRLLDAL